MSERETANSEVLGARCSVSVLGTWDSQSEIRDPLVSHGRGMISRCDHSIRTSHRAARDSRRGKRGYGVERGIWLHRGALTEPGDPASDAIELLRAAGSLQSALRDAARRAGINWRLARLVLILRPGYLVRVSDVAWQLGITTGAASRLCDAAEECALVDKLYGPDDRRGTDVALTSTGRALRARLEQILRGPLSTERRRGPAYGRRYWYESHHGLEDL